MADITLKTSARYGYQDTGMVEDDDEMLEICESPEETVEALACSCRDWLEDVDVDDVTFKDLQWNVMSNSKNLLYMISVEMAVANYGEEKYNDTCFTVQIECDSVQTMNKIKKLLKKETMASIPP